MDNRKPARRINPRHDGSIGRQESSIPRNSRNLGDTPWKPKSAEKPGPSIKSAKERSTREEMIRRSKVIENSASVLSRYIEENGGDPVQGLAQYSAEEAYTENAKSAGLEIEPFTQAVIARYELRQQLDQQVANQENS